jgi:hypothetical protein
MSYHFPGTRPQEIILHHYHQQINVRLYLSEQIAGVPFLVQKKWICPLPRRPGAQTGYHSKGTGTLFPGVQRPEREADHSRDLFGNIVKNIMIQKFASSVINGSQSELHIIPVK